MELAAVATEMHVSNVIQAKGIVDTMKVCAMKCEELFPQPRFMVVRMETDTKATAQTPICPLNFESDPDFFYNIQFQDSRGFSFHCIAIHQGLIFDSNQTKPLPLTCEGLDSCCLVKGDSFSRVVKGYCLFALNPLGTPVGPR
jgi:hypothetical protein